ncbi:MAG TPA: ABC transporter permease [Dongiaceae bacterium]|nr:ABC transporter permease [Dongiaceae bacterium]
MSGYLARRLLAALPTLLGISLLAFALLSLLPSDPILTWSEGMIPASAAEMERLRTALRSDESPAERYADWLLALLRGDLGASMRDGRPVTTLIAEALPWTIVLNGAAVVLIYALGLPLGWALSRRRRPMLGGASGLLLLLSVVPPFAAALLLQRLFAVRLGLLPLQGTGVGGGLAVLPHLVLPALCLALSGWGFVARYARVAFRSAMPESAIAAARARGLAGLSLGRHFAANAALPFLWMLGGLVPALLSGSVIVEEIFSWPGMGRLLLRGVEGRDYPLVLTLVFLSGVAVLLGQLLADLLLPALDPRARAPLVGTESGE